jgi:hypothetical protein
MRKEGWLHRGRSPPRVSHKAKYFMGGDAFIALEYSLSSLTWTVTDGQHIALLSIIQNEFLVTLPETSSCLANIHSPSFLADRILILVQGAMCPVTSFTPQTPLWLGLVVQCSVSWWYLNGTLQRACWNVGSSYLKKVAQLGHASCLERLPGPRVLCMVEQEAGRKLGFGWLG